MSANVLDLPNLYKLVKDLGLDLLDLWKLERFWVVDMFTRLNALQFVNSLIIEDTVLLGQALAEINAAGNAFKSLSLFSRFSSILTVETYTDPTQSTPSIPYIPSASVPTILTINPLPSNNILYPPDAGLEFDRAIQHHGIIQMIASLQSVDSAPGPEAGPASYPTPSTHNVNSPAPGGLLITASSGCSPQLYQVGNTPQLVSTPYSASAATPVDFVNTPGPDAGASSYPTPSTHHADSPR
ncbi:hypothetical protein KXV98_004028, partial [Aspergillus fumigatus]